MRILYCKVFGLGNAVMSVPAIKALASIHGPIDVLIGSLPDDTGALDVFAELKRTSGCVDAIYINNAPLDIVYDVAVLAIPFDGRWREGEHFSAKRVMDGRPRPGDPNVLGIECWKRGEADYQIDNAILLGYDGPTNPTALPSRFCPTDDIRYPDRVYLGIGFKRDAQTFWSKKHWGNERFIAFCSEIIRLRPQTSFMVTGGNVDIPIMREIAEAVPRTHWKFQPIRLSLSEVSKCGAFFGNDTGMAHVAASFDIPTYMMTAFKGSEIKNPPWCTRAKCNPFHTKVMEPESVAADFIDFVWGPK